MSNKVDFLYLNEQEMLAAGVSDMSRCIESMEEMFRLLNRGDYRMGGVDANEHGIKVFFPKTSDIEGMPLDEPDKRFMAMPAYLGGRFHAFGIKTYGSNHRNKELNLPRSILMLSLMDVDTGAPLAYMSANILSAMRTGAVTGVGAKYLSIPQSKTLAIIGPGVMGRYALDSFMVTRPSIRTVKVKGRGKSNLERFVKYVGEKYPSIENCVICDSIEEACHDSDIVYFGTTNAAKYEDNPYVNEKWLKKGALVISASALLVDTDFLAHKPLCKIVADNYKMYEGWGHNQKLPTQRNVSTLLGMGFYDAVCEGKIVREDIADMGKIICGEQIGRESEDQIVLYAVGGMPIEDVAWGVECYKRALENGIGTTLNLWQYPELMK